MKWTWKVINTKSDEMSIKLVAMSQESKNFCVALEIKKKKWLAQTKLPNHREAFPSFIVH